MTTKFQPGESGNPSGRKPGVPNKVTGDLRSVISKVLSTEMSHAKLRSLLKSLRPADKLDLMIKLTSFVLPKLRETDLTLNLEKMDEKSLDIIISKILKNDDNEDNSHD